MASFFHGLQQEIADRLAADPFFEDIPCLWELKKDVESEVQAAISNIGAGVIVITPTASADEGNLPGPWYGDIGIVVQCYSDPITAADKPRAMEIAERVVSLLHHWTPASLSVPLVAEKPTIVPEEVDHPTGDGRGVRLKCSGGTGFQIPTVATPVIEETAGVVTITCATPGAAIFYRTNGRRPVPRTAILYTGPFTPDPGSNLSVGAWLAGYLASDIATLSIP